QASGNGGVSPRAPRDLAGAVLAHLDAEHPRTAAHNRQQLLVAVEFEPHRDAEAVPERRGEEAGPGGGADEGELCKLDPDRAGGGTLADDQVELKILHRRIEDLLDRRVEAMDLVDEENVALLEIGQEGRKIAGAGDHRAGGGAEIHRELSPHDLGKRGLAQPRRAGKQDMVERLVAGPGGSDEHLEIGTRLGLADEVAQTLRT